MIKEIFLSNSMIPYAGLLVLLIGTLIWAYFVNKEGQHENKNKEK